MKDNMPQFIGRTFFDTDFKIFDELYLNGRKLDRSGFDFDRRKCDDLIFWKRMRLGENI